MRRIVWLGTSTAGDVASIKAQQVSKLCYRYWAWMPPVETRTCSTKVVHMHNIGSKLFCLGADHRGTPEAPGRTVTLVPDASTHAWGIAYKLPDDLAEREKALQV